MLSAFETTPRSAMNSPQRAALVVWLLVAVALIFFHNPISGYDGSDAPLISSLAPEWRGDSSLCANSSMEVWRSLESRYQNIMINPRDTTLTPQGTAASLAVLGEYQALTRRCINWKESSYLGEPQPVLDWRSRNAYWPPLAPFATFMWAQGCAAAVALLVLVIVRSTKSSKPEGPGRTDEA